MKTRHFIIYGLVDPITKDLRYVGWSSNGLSRPSAKHSAHCLNWERSLEKRGLKKEIVILQELSGLTDDEANQIMGVVETGWISYFRNAGYDLTNITNGGQGSVGRKLSEKSKSKLSKSRKGSGNPMYGKRPHSAGKQGWMTGVKGKDHPMYGFKHSEENRKKMSDAARKYWASRRSEDR